MTLEKLQSPSLTPTAAKALLEAADWLQRPQTRALCGALAAAGIPARVVGGAVRNTLLGLPVDDIDIATPAPPQAVIRAATAAGFASVPTGIEHGTVTVVVDHHPFEVTTLRRDVSTDGRRATVAFTDDWREDAGRRDFTINALYCDPDGTLHDPVGGLADIPLGRVRFIGNADTRIAEDYLRILRFFRFFARFGTGELDRDGALACERGWAGLAILSRERVHAELMKLLVAPRAVEAVVALQSHGLLVPVLGGVGAPGRLARLVALEQATGSPPNAALRLAALAVWTAEDAARLADRLALSNAERAIAVDCAAPPAGDASDREALYRLGPDPYRRQTLTRWLETRDPASDLRWHERVALPARWPPPRFPVNGRMLMQAGLAQGVGLGQALARLERHWIDSDFVLTADELLGKL